jgi:uncharacterized membrane protein YecN with MAPEG domain
MLLPITATVASVLTFLYIGLSARVIQGRMKGEGPEIGVKDEGDEFFRVVRAHANFSEYTPLFLILLGLLELADAPSLFVSLLGGTFIIGRISHWYGLTETGRLRFRTLGMVLTLMPLLGAAILLLREVF